MEGKDHINITSFLNLQSEYLTERAKFESRKGFSRVLEKPVGLTSIKKLLVDSNHHELQLPDDDEWEKSRTSLEKKARIYDELSNGGKSATFGCVNSEHLVDFAQKGSIPDHTVILRPENFVSKLLDPKDEIIDEFGRTRKADKAYNGPVYYHDNNPAQDVYSDSSDVRTLGIGFYRFSRTSEERRDQMKNLSSRRLETMTGREEYAQLLQRRKEWRQQRVAVALARKQRLSPSS